MRGSFSDAQITEEALYLALEDVHEDRQAGESFKILLAHRPELFPIYAQFEFNLAFSGHAYGGQVILPFVGGLVAPNQGFFPKYYAGKYVEKKTTMVVSRGLGNSIIPLRLFNRPEIVVVKLISTTD